jgi:murein DD-endopeptidase MepM/ murein hydrolase activator NlpD
MPTSQRPGAEAPEELLAEEIESPANAPRSDETSLTRRSRARGGVSRRQTAVRPAAAKPTMTSRRAAAKPLRSLVTLALVGGLVATAAIPAFGLTLPAEETVTLQQDALDNAQSLVVASGASASELSRESYSATTQQEIDEKKAKVAAEAARAAAEAAAAAVAAAKARMSPRVASSTPSNFALVSPGSGQVRWPILNFTKGRGLWDSGYHQGVDLLAGCGTPLYAAAGGVVKVSQESFGGYGVAVTIDHVLGGQRVSTLYGHMTYGSRQVGAGQTVQAGQLIGFVGSTGSSTACHLHFEVHINGGVVDPWAWLQANAG